MNDVLQEHKIEDSLKDYCALLLATTFRLVGIAAPELIPLSRHTLLVWTERPILRSEICQFFESCFIDPSLKFASKSFKAPQFDFVWEILNKESSDINSLNFLDLKPHQSKVIDEVFVNATTEDYPSEINPEETIDSRPELLLEILKKLSSEFVVLKVKCSRIDDLCPKFIDTNFEQSVRRIKTNLGEQQKIALGVIMKHAKAQIAKNIELAKALLLF